MCEQSLHLDNFPPGCLDVPCNYTAVFSEAGCESCYEQYRCTSNCDRDDTLQSLKRVVACLQHQSSLDELHIALREAKTYHTQSTVMAIALVLLILTALYYCIYRPVMTVYRRTRTRYSQKQLAKPRDQMKYREIDQQMEQELDALINEELDADETIAAFSHV